VTLRIIIDDAVRRASSDLARQREEAVREIAAERLPRLLRFLVYHPKALKAAYRLWPRWRPTVRVGVDVAMHRAGADTVFVVSETLTVVDELHAHRRVPRARP
jgi:hypothetical protein